MTISLCDIVVWSPQHQPIDQSYSAKIIRGPREEKEACHLIVMSVYIIELRSKILHALLFIATQKSNRISYG